MSYDIWLEVDAGGPEPISIGDWNFTSNCSPMWNAAGIDLAACEGRVAADCIEELGAAIATLKADSARFQVLNPSNGWGSYENLVPALETLLRLFEQAPRATVRVWR